MSVLRPLLSRRGRLAFAATALLLIVALLAVPSVGGAAAAVKQFVASISPAGATGGVAGSWTETITNCGGLEALPEDCTRASTIGLGAVRISVPTEFQPITSVAAMTPGGTIWPASYNLTTRTIDVIAPGGSSKLEPGQSLLITFSATPAACDPGAKTFTTGAWGSVSLPGSNPFTLQGDPPTVTVAEEEGCLESGESITDPGTGQTETITGDFTGHVLVRFGGEEGPDCSDDVIFGALGDQWQQYHLPTQVVITPGDDFVPGSSPKVSRSEFDQSIGVDSSWYLICYASPTAFVTRGGGDSVPQTIDGTEFQVGILASCVDAPTPCVSEQFLTLTGDPHRVVISVRIPPNDPYKR
jgi:hypothetical protein